MNAVAYLRSAVPNEAAIKRQEAEIQRYCRQNGLNLLATFSDNGAGGAVYERSGWRMLQAYLVANRGSVQALVITNYERLSRNAADTMIAVAKLMNEFGIEVQATAGKLLNEDIQRSHAENLPMRTGGAFMVIRQETKRKPEMHPLLNRWVAVHPDLTTDPLHKQGEIGKVTMISALQPDEATVRFADGQVGRYAMYGLLILNSKEVIVQALQADRLGTQNMELISSVLRNVGRKNDEALRLALSNDTSRFFCLTDCQSWLDMKMEQRKNQRKAAQRRKRK